METESNGDGEFYNREPAALGRPQKNLHGAIKALEGTKDVFAQELSRLRALNESIPENRSFQKMEGSQEEIEELPECPALLQNLMKAREVLSEEVQEQKGRCEELERKLEQEHAEKLEAQVCLNVLNETVIAALQGEKFLVDQNRHLVLDQQALSSKLDKVKNLEAICHGIKHEELVGALHSKIRIRGLWVFAELVVFCHAILWCLMRTLKETHSFAPT